MQESELENIACKMVAICLYLSVLSAPLLRRCLLHLSTTWEPAGKNHGILWLAEHLGIPFINSLRPHDAYMRQ